MVGHARAQGARRRTCGRSSPPPSRAQALAIASEVARQWREKGHEKVAEHLEEHIEECLTCLAFPESHRRRIRTTNGLERLNQEIKRRTRVVRIFPNRAGVLEAGYGAGGRAIGGMGYGQTLPGHARARGTAP